VRKIKRYFINDAKSFGSCSLEPYFFRCVAGAPPYGDYSEKFGIEPKIRPYFAVLGSFDRTMGMYRDGRSIQLERCSPNSRAASAALVLPEFTIRLLSRVHRLKTSNSVFGGSARFEGRRPFVVSRMQSLVPNGSLITAHFPIVMSKGATSIWHPCAA
jgi:hypothetical protein